MFKKTMAMLLCVAVLLGLGTMAFAADEPVRITVQAEAATEKFVCTGDTDAGCTGDLTGAHTSNRVINQEDGYHYAENNKDRGYINFCPHDWYTYTFTVDQAGKYTFGLTGSCDRTETPFDVYLDGTKISDANTKVTSTGYSDVKEHDLVSGLELEAKTYTIKISLPKPYSNFNFWADAFWLEAEEIYENSVQITVQAEAATEKFVCTGDTDAGCTGDLTGAHTSNRVINQEDGYHYAENNKDRGYINFCPHDWYTYTFTVDQAGKYTFGLTGSCDRTETPFDVYLDGTKISDANTKVTSTGYSDVKEHDLVSGLELSAGTYTIKISLPKPYSNFNFWADCFWLRADELKEEPDPTEESTEATEESTEATEESTEATTESTEGTTESTEGTTESTEATTKPTNKPIKPATEILKGSPAVDGKLDDIYKYSYSISMDNKTAPVIGGLVSNDTDNLNATVYFLHDGEYLYICGVVTGDSTIVDTVTKGWACDALEIWFLLPEQPLRTKITMDAFGHPYGTDIHFGDRENSHEISESDVIKAATRGDGTYVVEAKLPIPYYLASENSLAINVQLNNVYDEDINSGMNGKQYGIYGKQYSNIGEELDAHIVKLSSKSATVIPETGDFSSLIVALLAISGLGIVVVANKKKER